MGFIGWYQILVIGLKLAKIITWSWGWVLLPIWIFALSVLIVIFAMMIFGKIDIKINK